MVLVFFSSLVFQTERLTFYMWLLLFFEDSGANFACMWWINLNWYTVLYVRRSVFILHLMHVLWVIHPYKVAFGLCEQFGCWLQTQSRAVTQLQYCIPRLNPTQPHSIFLSDPVVRFEELTDQPPYHWSSRVAQLFPHFFSPHHWTNMTEKICAYFNTGGSKTISEIYDHITQCKSL